MFDTTAKARASRLYSVEGSVSLQNRRLRRDSARSQPETQFSRFRLNDSTSTITSEYSDRPLDVRSKRQHKQNDRSERLVPAHGTSLHPAPARPTSVTLHFYADSTCAQEDKFYLTRFATSSTSPASRSKIAIGSASVTRKRPGDCSAKRLCPLCEVTVSFGGHSALAEFPTDRTQHLMPSAVILRTTRHDTGQRLQEAFHTDTFPASQSVCHK